MRISSFSENSSSALKLAMSSSYDTLVIDDIGKPWILPPMHFSNVKNKIIIFEKGVDIFAKKGAFLKLTDMLFRFTDCSNIQLIGHGNSLTMNKPEYTEGEWRHCLSFMGCKDIVIKNLCTMNSGGDGIYISKSNKLAYSENISIENVVSSNNRRQGMSIISGKNITVTNSIFENTNGTLPEAGLDLEPNSNVDRLESIAFNDCVFRNNNHAGILVALGNLDSSSLPVSIKFTDCLIQNNHSPENRYIASEIVFGADKERPVKGYVILENCVVEDSKWGIFYSRKTAEAYTVTFKNCVARNICKDESYPAIYLEVADYANGPYSLGGYVFDSLYVDYETEVPLFQVRGSSRNTLSSLSDVGGTIIVAKREGEEKRISYIKYDPEENSNVSLEFINQSPKK